MKPAIAEQPQLKGCLALQQGTLMGYRKVEGVEQQPQIFLCRFFGRRQLAGKLCYVRGERQRGQIAPQCKKAVLHIRCIDGDMVGGS